VDERRKRLRLLVVDQESAVEREVERAWVDAAHHLDVARRLGEESPPREDLFLAPETWRAVVGRLGRIVLDQDGAGIEDRFDVLPPESVDRDIRRLRAGRRRALP
jgi:hypothetical protein